MGFQMSHISRSCFRPPQVGKFYSFI
uniref:Uncharacterized protein n=1 Tax=Arundo donax TaxID=35708 RepID=A0A0A9AA46_ARUDO